MVKTYEEVERLYWDIGEVAKMFGVASSAVRFWLSELDIEIAKNKKGNRKFTVDDIEKMTLVAFLCGGEDNKRLHISYVKYLIDTGAAESVFKLLKLCEPSIPEQVKVVGTFNNEHAAHT